MAKEREVGGSATVSVKRKTVIKVYVCRDGTGTTWSASQIASDANGRTAIGYIKLK